MTTFVYNLPVVNGSEDTWGTTINANWTNIGTFIGALDSAELAKLDGLTASTAELNILDGLTASQAELNILDGLTASTAQLNYVAGVTSAVQTQLNAKADDSTTISAGGGLTGGGDLGSNRTISHSDTSSQGSVNNSGNTVIQDISVDTYGHVTSIGSKALSIPAAYTQPTGAGGVGTYVWALRYANNTSVMFGTSYAGPGLRPAGFSATSWGVSSTAFTFDDENGDLALGAGTGTPTLGGTWRCMGRTNVSSGTYDNPTTLFLRIS